jgi:hypothetical protein
MNVEERWIEEIKMKSTKDINNVGNYMGHRWAFG